MPARRGVFALFVSIVVVSATVAATPPPGPAAVATWPVSTGLVLAEVATGGTSASDEYVEIANAGPADADLGGCELVYVTASGATLTRKASFGAPIVLMPGQHLLVANTAGIFGPLADATYSSGLAADGGAVVLRRQNGTVVDAVGWGTATNSYVEGSVAPAPPAKSSIERQPGSSSGNRQDTNDNRTDWLVQSNPVPQSLASNPVPGPSPTPTATATLTPTATATTPEPTPPGLTPAPTEPELTPEPTQPSPPAPEPSPTPGATPTVEPIPTPTPTPIPTPTPTPLRTPTPTPTTPTPTTPTPTRTTTPTRTPTPTPIPTPTRTPTPTSVPTVAPSASPSGFMAPLEPIADARKQPMGARVHVAGVVTARPGLVGAELLIAVRDSSGAIFVRLSQAESSLSEGRSVELEGALSAPYGQLEIREITALKIGAIGEEPEPLAADLVDIGELTEAGLVTVAGAVQSVQTDSGRVTIVIGNGIDTVRLLADPPTGVSSNDVARGDNVVATGIVGQHATATGRLDGYRVWLRSPDDLVVTDPPSTGTPEPSSTLAPADAEPYRFLSSALGIRGAAVDVEATVTSTVGLLDIGSPTLVVDDGTAAVAVILPGAADAPTIGMRVEVTGKVGRWEGGPTVVASSVVTEGELDSVAPVQTSGSLDGSLEWQLVRVCGKIVKYTPAGSRWRIDMAVDGNTVTVLGEPAAAISMAKSAVGRLAIVTGIVRRSTSDSSTFQLLPRMPLDLLLGPAPGVLGSTASSGRSSSSGSTGRRGALPGSIDIQSLPGHLGETVTVAGLVTDTQVDVDTTTATVDDGTGEVRLGGAAAAEAIAMLEPGDAIEATGVVEQDYLGLIIETDPASIIDLPGEDTESQPSDEAGAAAVVPDRSTMAAPVSTAAAGSMRLASSAAPIPDAPTAAFLLMILVALAGIAVVAMRSRRLRSALAPGGARHGGHRGDE